MSNLGIYFGWKENAGLVCVSFGPWSLHIGVHRRDRVWGTDETCPYLWLFGAGPVFLLAWGPT